MKLEQFMKKQRLISLLILLALLLSMGSVCVLAEDDTQEDVSDGPFEVDAKAAILIDMNTGRTVYEKNIDERIYPASLTKIMTCLLALENGNLSDIVTIDEGAFAGLDGNSSTAGLQVGEQLTFNDLLYCLMISSGNEAANAVAEHIAGSIPDFVRMMNERAYELGCTGTHFANPHGLHDEEHYTTVRDLVAITLAALKSDNFRTITNTRNESLSGAGAENDQSADRRLDQQQQLLQPRHRHQDRVHLKGGPLCHFLREGRRHVLSRRRLRRRHDGA